MTSAKIGLEPKIRDHCPQNTQHGNKKLSSSTFGGGANTSTNTTKYLKDEEDGQQHCNRMINDNMAASIGTYRPNTQSYRMMRVLQQVIFLLALILFKYGGAGSHAPLVSSLTSFFPFIGRSPSSFFAFANEEATTTITTTEEAEETSSGGLPKEAQIILAVILICLTAVFAGLTIGIMGVDTLTLEIIAEGGNEPDASYAKTLLPVRKMGHHALATLVLGNMWANVMIAQFCADVNPEGGGGGGEGEEEGVGGLIAFFMSTLIILIFGEILPMSVCKSSQALRIAAAGVPLLKVFIVLLYPLAKPLGWMLDTMIHHNVGQIYDRNELKELMKLHANRLAAESGLDTDEGNILVGILEFKDKAIGSVMTKIEDTICVSEDCLIDRPLLKALWAVGRSRVPVVRGTVGTPICITDPRSAVSMEMKQHIVGILYIKDLITYNVKGTTVGEYLRSEQQREVRHILTTDTLPKVMALAQTGVAHMFVVREPMPPKAQRGEDLHAGSPASLVVSPSSIAYNNAAGLLNNVTNATNAVVGGLLSVFGKVVGICTMEDVLEALIKSEIYDENDDEDNLEIEQEMAEMGAATGQSPAAMRRAKATRVNLYSFHIPFPETTVNGSPLANGAQSLTATSSALPTPTVKPLNEVERNAIAKYLRNTVPAFAFWRLGALRALLAEATDEVIMPIAVSNALEDSNSTIDGSSSVNSPTTATSTNAAIINSEQQLRTLNSSVREAIALAKTKAATPEAFINDVPKKNLIAQQGVPMGEFILVLSGCVDVCFGIDGFKSEITTMSFMAESVLMDGKPFVPTFSARVTRRPTRLLRVSYPLYRSHEHKMMAQLNNTNSANGTSAYNANNGTTSTATRLAQAAAPQPPPSLLNPIVTRANPTGAGGAGATTSTSTGVSRPLTSDSLPRPQYVSRFATTGSSATVASSISPSSPTPLVK